MLGCKCCSPPLPANANRSKPYPLLEADETNRTQEEELGRQIGQLTDIADQNKAAGDAATANRKVSPLSTASNLRVSERVAIYFW